VKNLIPFPKATCWFDVRNIKDDSADLYIYDVVGDSWTGNDAITLVKAIAGLKKKRINAHINSPGGSVFDGVAVYNALKNHDGGVTTYVDGLAASIASIIALAGDKVVMADNAMMMIHNPWTMAMGDADDMRKTADVLDQIKETLINTYATKTGKARDIIAADMEAETWFTAQQAMDYGFVTEIVGGMKIAASLSMELAELFGMKKAPKALTPEPSSPVPIKLSLTPRSLLERRQALIEKQN
jgi:ATP-dependent Clp endopeptidase proteolytic subunit ClpP